MLYGVTMETPGVSKLVSVELRKRDDGGRTVPQNQDAVAVAVA